MDSASKGFGGFQAQTVRQPSFNNSVADLCPLDTSRSISKYRRSLQKQILNMFLKPAPNRHAASSSITCGFELCKLYQFEVERKVKTHRRNKYRQQCVLVS